MILQIKIFYHYTKHSIRRKQISDRIKYEVQVFKFWYVNDPGKDQKEVISDCSNIEDRASKELIYKLHHLQDILKECLNLQNRNMKLQLH